MDESNPKPKLCSFCSLVCELPDQDDRPAGSEPWCIKRSGLRKLVPLRLASMASAHRSGGVLKSFSL
jgi:hypothetical protein